MLNQCDAEYHRLLQYILDNGREKTDRTGTGTIGVFGLQGRFDLQKQFPILTTKKVFMKGITHELLWFLKGDNNIKYLVDNDVHIWDDWPYKRYVEACDVDDASVNKWCRPNQDGTCSIMTREEFIYEIKEDKEFAEKWGDLGEGTYGGMWRGFPYHTTDFKIKDANADFIDVEQIVETGYIDQIAKVIKTLKTRPDDRRIIVSAWHPHWVDNCALPPCHALFQFNTVPLTQAERVAWAIDWARVKNGRRFDNIYPTTEQLDEWGVPKYGLSCQLYQRSADFALGSPFNITSYALLTHMVAQCVNMIPWEFVYTLGDSHIYKNHIDGVKEQLTRIESKSNPQLQLNPDIKNIDDFKFEDIKILNYESWPKIHFDISV
tara:strand:+ start:1 stop:1131 length:1131 start_codon:yes stop_codon:yes gene_type:complete